MTFTKMHGLGNNYVFFDLLMNQDNAFQSIDYSKLSRQVSDVNFGIGSDGIILISPSEQANFNMRIFNEDGSEAKNCGNGLRCVAKYVYDHQYISTPQFTIETLGGVVDVEVEVNSDGAVDFIKVDMGEPRLLKGEIPMKGDASSTTVNEAFTIGGAEYHLSCVSMGNPHAILFVEDVQAVVLEKIGPMIEHSDLFPERVNVGIVHVKNRSEMDYRVWERGSGITMACGTGACASVVAASLNDLIDKNKSILVHLPGGDLTIKWDARGHVWMRGEASYICRGELEEDFLVDLKK